MKQQSFLLLVILLTLCRPVFADGSSIHVKLDASEAPHLNKWGEDARSLIVRWHPRISNLLPTKGVKPPRTVTLKLRESDKGVASTSGTTIKVSSHWIEKHPDDFGVVIHELTHVVQSYSPGKPWSSAKPLWLAEGIADYIRWGIYEGKAQAWFPRPKEKRGYEKGYHVAAGFLLWLESETAPGIVKKLNTAMRKGTYSEKIFNTETGRSLDELWDAYVTPERDVKTGVRQPADRPEPEAE